MPHEINGFKPLFLRRGSALRLAGLLVFIELILFVLPTLYFPQYARDLNLGSVLPGVLSTLTNEERLSNDLLPLSVNPILARAAQLKAEDMARKGYFAHNSPEGLTSWYWFELVGYRYQYAGENLAVNFSDSEEVTRAWMQSPSHQANLVGINYTEMGTGIASGIYKGRETVFVVQLYGTPKPVVVAKPAAPAEEGNSRALPSLRGLRRDENLPSSSSPAQVLGESVPESQSQAPTFLKRLMSSPKEATNAALYLTLAVVVVALFLNVAIKFEYQYPDLFMNGAVVVLLIIGIHLGNNLIAARDLETSFVEFSQESDVVSLR